MKERRIKRVLISPRILIAMLTEGNEVSSIQAVHCISGVPEDAEVLDADLDYMNNNIQLFLYHESWDVVPDGEIPPTIKIEYQAEYGEDA